MDIKKINKQIDSLLWSIVVKTEKIEILINEIKLNREELKKLKELKRAEKT